MKFNYLGDLFIYIRWYFLAGIGAVLFLVSFFIEFFWHLAVIYLIAFLVLTLLDFFLLFNGNRIQAHRIVADRLGLGDENKVSLSFFSNYGFPAKIMYIDELPVIFQERNFRRYCLVLPGRRVTETYILRPVMRGEYMFERILCYVRSPLNLLQRRYRFDAAKLVRVYPSTRQLKKYQLLALSDNTQFAGVKKMRRLGHSLEFEQIREYVQGDDIRTVNWKATARKNNLMVNNFTDAKSQLVYCLIDKGRAMKMPFDGMTLLDHSINAALMFLNITLLKQDRAGLITFSSGLNELIPADRAAGQMSKLMEALYKQRTDFAESNYETLTSLVRHKISQRSFLLLFTNFETMASLERQLPYLQRLASRHLLCVVFFENTLLKEIHEGYADTLEGIYIKTIADRFSFEKKQIVRELRRHGILSVLTTPQNLTVDVVNKYLELKSRQMI